MPPELQLDRKPTNADEKRDLAVMLARFLGEAVMAGIRDLDVSEVYVNPDGRLWFVRQSSGHGAVDERLSASQIHHFLNAVASDQRVELTGVNPVLQAELPRHLFHGSRLQGWIPPRTEAPAFNLRKLPTSVIPLEEYVARGELSYRYGETIRYAVSARQNILVAGPTGSGKTTFLNMLVHDMERQSPQDRFVILEDTPELLCGAENVLKLRVTSSFTLADLVKETLRATPKRIIVGEVRGGEAYSLLDALSTGHPGGAASMHAESPEGALYRLDRLCRMNNIPSQRELIADAVHLVVMIKPTAEGRRVTDLAQVTGLNRNGRFVLERLPDQ